MIGDVAEVGPYLRLDHPERPGGQLLQRPAERHHGPPELQEFTLELVDASRVDPRAVLREHLRLDMVDVLLDRLDDAQEIVHHMVRDRVQHRRGALRELGRIGLQSFPQRPSEPCLPCRTVTTKSGPANTMISPVLTTSLVAVSSSCST